MIPHIRAIDIAPDAPLPCAQQSGVNEILVVEGDPPADPLRPTIRMTASVSFSVTSVRRRI